MFVDQAKIYVKAGDGGKGCNSLYRDRVNRIGTPDGGPGGDGGNVIIEVDKNVHTLLDFQYRQHFTGNSGEHGGSNHKKGARGANSYIKVPPGTLIKDCGTGMVLRDLVNVGDSVIIAKGGEGGTGNSRHREATFGMPGDERRILLELKMMADVGIIGYPNSGKSTLISKISSARPKIANYPFTTKEPVLGVVHLRKGKPMVVADIPGLIEGAHEGRGLGDRFLRHVERTRLLVHVIDISGFECRNPYDDYRKLNKELKLYSNVLGRKKQIIALNKIDLPSAKTNIKLMKAKLRGKKVFPISALRGEGLEKLLVEMYKEA